MEYFKSLCCCLIPSLRANRNRRREQQANETIIEKRRIEQITRLLYSVKKARILDTIKFPYSRALIVWVVSEEDLRTQVLTTLHSIGRIVRIEDRWLVKEDEDEEETGAWKGVIAEFAYARDAETALDRLPILIRHVRTTLMKTVIETFAHYELLSFENRKDKEEQEPTKLVISRRTHLSNEEFEFLKRDFSTYGNMQTFFINPCAVLEVTYPYLTHAYLALLMTDGQSTYKGTLRMSLEKTEKYAEILQNAKVFMKHLEQEYFPI